MKVHERGRGLCLALAFTAVALPACSDPLLDEKVAALGPEVDGIREGPAHRAGQPCLVCHGNGVSPDFSVAGTLYQKPYELGVPVGIEGNIVELIDANGERMRAKTNCVGNFYISRDRWDPTFPLRVVVDPDHPGPSQMVSKIGRDGACASCHVDPPGQSSPGHVYQTDDDTVPDATSAGTSCRGDD